MIDPATGVSKISTTYKLPSGQVLNGDLVRLADGDVLAALGDGTLTRLHPDGTSTSVGTVTGAFALAATGGGVLIGTFDGKLLRLATVPTAASTGPLATTPLDAGTVGAAGFYGGASIQDAGECNVPLTADDTATTRAGAPVSKNVLSNDTSGGATTRLVPGSVRLLNGTTPVSTVTIAKVGTFTADAAGSVRFVPFRGFSGVATATYRVSNDLGQSATGTFRVTVAAAPASSSAASSSASSSSQVTPTAVPAGYEQPGGDATPLLVIGGIAVLVIVGVGGNLIRTRRSH